MAILPVQPAAMRSSATAASDGVGVEAARRRGSGSEEHEQDGRRSHRDADHGEGQDEALTGARIPALRSAACSSR